MRMRAAGRPRVLVGNIDQARPSGLGQNGIEFGSLSGAIEELPIAVIDRDLIPETDVDGVSRRQIRYAVLVERHPGVRIVHHRHRFRGSMRECAGREVMRQPQRMPRFMGGQLPGAGQRHGQHGIVLRREFPAHDIGREQRLRDEIVLPASQ